MAKKKIKISQVVKIIVSDLTIDNISGLLGLLSSLSLNTKIKNLDIYGPKGLDFYLLLGRKYSQTYFRYKLSIHTVMKGWVFKENSFMLYAFLVNDSLLGFNYFIVIPEMPGKFNLIKADMYNIPHGPLYGKLKKDYKFLMPDGFILCGNSFTQNHNLGMKIGLVINICTRNLFEFLYNTTYLINR